MSEDPRALLERVTVLGNEEIAEGVWLLTLQAPRVAADVEPGQFVHLRISEGASFILRRPFSVHRAYGERIELLYQVLGTGTRAMSAKDCGDVMDIIGPLGTGWCVPDDAGEVLLVGGGLGAAPLGMLAEDLRARGIGSVAALGAPTAARLVGREIFESAADLVELATDDGSEGESGFVTVVSDRLLAQRALGMVCVCGPEAMARTVAEQSQAGGVPCRVSLERLMACGVGACLSCVVRTTTGHKRACVEGPVFDAADIVWGAEYTLKH
jgi:dihydroorotate dehydrogenase electron transfer subunit